MYEVNYYYRNLSFLHIVKESAVVYIVEGSCHVHKYNAVYIPFFPCVVYVLRQDGHGIYRCSLRSSSKVVRWQEVVYLDEVAQQFRDDTSVLNFK